MWIGVSEIPEQSQPLVEERFIPWSGGKILLLGKVSPGGARAGGGEGMRLISTVCLQPVSNGTFAGPGCEREWCRRSLARKSHCGMVRSRGGGEVYVCVHLSLCSVSPFVCVCLCVCVCLYVCLCVPARTQRAHILSPLPSSLWRCRVTP